MTMRQVDRSRRAHRVGDGSGVALGSPARWLAAVALVVSGAVHIPVTPEHLKEAPYMGYLFIALTTACFVLAVLIVALDSRTIWLLSGAVTTLAVLGYALSRTVALPHLGDDVGDWTEPLGVVAILAEALTALVAVAVLRHHMELTEKEVHA